MDAGRARLAILAAAWAVFVLAVYCPDVGRGFVKDDFTWIRAAKSAIAQPAHLIVPKERAFYRPLVTASFALDYASHRWQPRGYGWTNVALYVACTAAVGILAFAIGLSEYAAILAAFLWAVNPHGVNMAVLWVEGARVSQRTLVAIRSNADALPKRGRIVLADERGATVSNFRNAFGDLTTEALQTAFNRQWEAVIVDDDNAPPQDVIAHYRLDRGRIVATVPPPQ